MKLSAPAKINLFLHITGRREDGYHSLQTLFQLLDYGDDIELEADASGRLSVDCPGLNVPPGNNLAMRAAQMLKVKAPDAAGARIHIRKRIPPGGGLGGGSSDAASVLLGLNRLWGLDLGVEALARIGLSLGADVPLFVHGHSAWAEGVGEVLTPVELPNSWYLILAPDCEVSTAEVFSHRELTRNTSPITIAAFFAGGSRNDCESVVRRLYPEVDKALIWLEKFGQPRLTGTGACVFAAFPAKADAEAAMQALPAGWNGFVAEGLNTSPTLPAIE